MYGTPLRLIQYLDVCSQELNLSKGRWHADRFVYLRRYAEEVVCTIRDSRINSLA